ncbi:MAG: 3-isopropylmalate dehydratase small subunit [Nitrospirae bacterium]|nr:3-isopropylmalate dehydratase small subunit [Nitrospirota bacterium]
MARSAVATLTYTGRVWRFGDDVDTDQIIPAAYLVTSDPAELAKHCLEIPDPEFSRKAQPGDILVAGKNFGCGSSREHAPWAIKGLGIHCIIAKSFARIFYRNAFNIGMCALECPEAADAIASGAIVTVNPIEGAIQADGRVYRAQPLPEFMQQLVSMGGLMPWVKTKIESRRRA